MNGEEFLPGRVRPSPRLIPLREQLSERPASSRDQTRRLAPLLGIQLPSEIARRGDRGALSASLLGVAFELAADASGSDHPQSTAGASTSPWADGTTSVHSTMSAPLLNHQVDNDERAI
jgi:hypothetical protein